MPSLKDLRNRIRSVRSTQKITAAMKMVAASRLRRAQEQAEAARPYAQRMERVLASLAGRMAGQPGAPPLLAGTGKDDVHLLVVATSDRGLAGGFNATILREARRRIRDLDNAGKTVKILTIGRKGRDSLRRDYSRLIHDSLTEIGRRRVSFDEARDIAARVLTLFDAGGFDVWISTESSGLSPSETRLLRLWTSITPASLAARSCGSSRLGSPRLSRKGSAARAAPLGGR